MCSGDVEAREQSPCCEPGRTPEGTEHAQLGVFHDPTENLTAADFHLPATRILQLHRQMSSSCCVSMRGVLAAALHTLATPPVSIQFGPDSAMLNQIVSPTGDIEFVPPPPARIEALQRCRPPMAALVKSRRPARGRRPPRARATVMGHQPAGANAHTRLLVVAQFQPAGAAGVHQERAALARAS